MKKGIFGFLMVLTVALICISGCGSSQMQTKKEEVYQNDLEDAPEWVRNPSSVEGGIAAVGSAKIGKAGDQFARTEALSAGRDELSRTMSVKVKEMVKNFTKTTGIGDDETVDKVSSQASKQVSSQLVVGSKHVNTWISKKGKMYVLVVVDTNATKKSVKESVETSLKNEQALWQQFQAKKADDELDKEVDKEFGGIKQEQGK